MKKSLLWLLAMGMVGFWGCSSSTEVLNYPFFPKWPMMILQPFIYSENPALMGLLRHLRFNSTGCNCSKSATETALLSKFQRVDLK